MLPSRFEIVPTTTQTLQQTYIRDVKTHLSFPLLETLGNLFRVVV